jgi:hypothetical protein
VHRVESEDSPDGRAAERRRVGAGANEGERDEHSLEHGGVEVSGGGDELRVEGTPPSIPERAQRAKVARDVCVLMFSVEEPPSIYFFAIIAPRQSERANRRLIEVD